MRPVKGADHNITPLESLKNEVQALKGEFDMLKDTVDALQKAVNDLKIVCNMHQRALEGWRRYIVMSQQTQGSLNSSYLEEPLELMEEN